MVNDTNIPPDIAYAYAVGNVPSDIPLALLLESRDGRAKIAIYIVFALTFLLLLLRCYSRIVVVRKFGLDDWLACATFVSHLFIHLSFLSFYLGCLLNGY